MYFNGKEGRKERRKEGKKERRKEGKKERKEEGRKDVPWCFEVRSLGLCRGEMTQTVTRDDGRCVSSRGCRDKTSYLFFKKLQYKSEITYIK